MYIVVNGLIYKGKTYRMGDIIELSDEIAEKLLYYGNITTYEEMMKQKDGLYKYVYAAFSMKNPSFLKKKDIKKETKKEVHLQKTEDASVEKGLGKVKQEENNKNMEEKEEDKRKSKKRVKKQNK